MSRKKIETNRNNPSDSKRMEEVLKENEEKFRKISDLSMNAIIMIDNQGKVTYWNEMAENIFGYSSRDIQGKDLLKHLVPKRYQARYKEGLRDFFITGRGKITGRRYEISALNKEGKEFPIELSVTGIKLKEETHALGVARDITERKKAEAQVRKLSRATQQSPASIIITNTKGVIEYVNPKFTEITGYSWEETIGRTPSLINSGEHSRGFYRDLWKTISSGKVWKGELHNRKKNGEFYWESASISPIKDDQGVITHYVGVKEDITDRKNWEAALEKAKEEAERASQAKSQFLSNMSHELRTPMNSILGFAQLLADPAEALNQDQRECARQILRSGRHLLNLINDALDLSRIESGRLSIHPEDFCLCPLVDETVSLIKPMAENKRVQILNHHDECRHQGKWFVTADRTRLKQALFNLLSNAVKYNRKGGKVSTSCQTVSNRFLRISVKDTGTGISPEKLSKLFEPFERLGAETTQIEGTGIGLTITRHLMEMMKGEAGVESSNQEGSCFYLDVPLTEQTSARQKYRKPSLAYSSQLESLENRYTLLYIENNPESLKLMESIIKRRPQIRLITAGDAQSGVKTALIRRPDLILLDLRLPDIDGYQVMDILQAHEETAHLPVIALSASPSPAKKDRKLFASYLTKPLDVGKLLLTVDTVLASISTKKKVVL